MYLWSWVCFAVCQLYATASVVERRPVQFYLVVASVRSMIEGA